MAFLFLKHRLLLPTPGPECSQYVANLKSPRRWTQTNASKQPWTSVLAYVANSSGRGQTYGDIYGPNNRVRGFSMQPVGNCSTLRRQLLWDETFLAECGSQESKRGILGFELEGLLLSQTGLLAVGKRLAQVRQYLADLLVRIG